MDLVSTNGTSILNSLIYVKRAYCHGSIVNPWGFANQERENVIMSI